MPVKSDTGWLKELRPQEKSLYIVLRASNWILRRAFESLYETYPEAHQYAESAFRQYELSDHGKKEIGAAREKLAAKTLKQGEFVLPGSRVKAYIDMALSLMEDFWAETKPIDRVRLAGEVRSQIEAIKSEVEPTGVGSEALQTLYEGFKKIQEEEALLASDPAN